MHTEPACDFSQEGKDLESYLNSVSSVWSDSFNKTHHSIASRDSLQNRATSSFNKIKNSDRLSMSEHNDYSKTTQKWDRKKSKDTSKQSQRDASNSKIPWISSQVPDTLAIQEIGE